MSNSQDNHFNFTDEQKILLPRICSHPFYETEAFAYEMDLVKETWISILRKQQQFCIYWGSTEKGYYLLSPSAREGIDYQLTYFDSKRNPISHGDYLFKDIGTGHFGDLLLDLPYSTKEKNFFITYFSLENSKTNRISIEKRIEDAAQKNINLSKKKHFDILTR